ncbi:hypothetical protein GGR51DRAFT_552296 [Nemania sp. FL0031]|nr:hypothetical protein GGR51DRAFT_552296 [Nemania sp. FL0031]
MLPLTFCAQKEITALNNLGDKSGLVLLIAQRINRSGMRGMGPGGGNDSVERGGQLLTRILPFPQAVFDIVSKSFYVHGSISPAISRADIPFFSYDEVIMKDSKGIDEKAWVYNCRSSNAWGKDLATTVTHFPHQRLSFGIIFGCSESQQEYIIQQVRGAAKESAHPLLLPGIFAEIERKRHHDIFESAIGNLESAMPNEEVGTILTHHRAQIDDLEQRKREAYLEVLHLKHGLESWSTQLRKMADNAQSLMSLYARVDHNEGGLYNLRATTQCSSNRSSQVLQGDAGPCTSQEKVQTDSVIAPVAKSPTPEKSNEIGNRLMERTTGKITRRLHAIIDEYGDKIRECQIRFDGITIATQLFQGETNLQVALATNKDSRHMKTIALVTMIFLPGTFFATVFSMGFFNWQGTGGEPQVSPSIWIYIVFSVVFTVFTLLVWYCFGTTNPKLFERSQSPELGNSV